MTVSMEQLLFTWTLNGIKLVSKEQTTEMNLYASESQLLTSLEGKSAAINSQKMKIH